MKAIWNLAPGKTQSTKSPEHKIAHGTVTCPSSVTMFCELCVNLSRLSHFLLFLSTGKQHIVRADHLPCLCSVLAVGLNPLVSTKLSSSQTCYGGPTIPFPQCATGSRPSPLPAFPSRTFTPRLLSVLPTQPFHFSALPSFHFLITNSLCDYSGTSTSVSHWCRSPAAKVRR